MSAAEATRNPRAGFCLPSHRAAFPADVQLHRELRRLVETGSELGYHTAWTWDHMLPAPAFYTSAWYESLAVLAACGGTELQLGTSILIAPTRNPVLTATTVSTIQQLTGQRMLLGVGTGWNEKEFAAAQVDRSRRGDLTDEFLEVLTLMFQGGGSYHGNHFQFDDVDPGHLGEAPEILIAGGSQISRAGSVEKPVMARGVAKRILTYGNWITRPSANPTGVEDDIRALQWQGEQLGLNASNVTRNHNNVMYLVETDDPVAARERQRPAFYSMMSAARGFDYFEDCYLVGSIPEIREQISAWSRIGLRDFSIYPLAEYEDQLHLWKKHLGDLLDFRS